MSKTVTFNRPRMDVAAVSADRWVASEQKATPSVPMKRFTIDVPADLHRRIKSQCAMDGTKMADVLREMLEKQFPVKS